MKSAEELLKEIHARNATPHDNGIEGVICSLETALMSAPANEKDCDIAIAVSDLRALLEFIESQTQVIEWIEAERQLLDRKTEPPPNKTVCHECDGTGWATSAN